MTLSNNGGGEYTSFFVGSPPHSQYVPKIHLLSPTVSLCSASLIILFLVNIFLLCLSLDLLSPPCSADQESPEEVAVVKSEKIEGGGDSSSNSISEGNGEGQVSSAWVCVGEWTAVQMGLAPCFALV